MSAHRQTLITGVNQAMRDGARQSAACDVIGTSAKTLQRWAQPDNVQDGRLDAHPKPSTTFTPSEREQIIKVASALAADLMTNICHREGVERDCVTLHSDNGSPMKGATLPATVHDLGVMPSFNRPSVSNDNPYSESLFRTLKYRPEYPEDVFANLHSARTWVQWFVDWYNNEHLHSSIQFVTPASTRTSRRAVSRSTAPQKHDTRYAPLAPMLVHLLQLPAGLKHTSGKRPAPSD